MFQIKKIKSLKKELTIFQVYAISTGTTLSAGFFLLPGLAAAQVGSVMVLTYLVAAISLIPAMFSVLELATAMPKAGGIYFFLDRALGPVLGTIGGIGTWFVLVFKVAFALIGMSVYLSIFFSNLEFTPIAIVLAVLLGIVNYFGAKKSGVFQIILVIGLLVLLAGFVGKGITVVNINQFKNIFDSGFSAIISTAGMVYISFIGLTNVASLSEEVKNPEKNLPRGIFLSFGTVIIAYIIGSIVMVGTVPIDKLAGNLTPVATSAEIFAGQTGVIILSVAALVAFISVENAGTMSASRYPLAMSRDHMMPALFKKLSRRQTPLYSIILTVSIIVLILVTMDPTKIAKLASAFQLLMFAFVCLAVIVMRESRIESFDPGYPSPFYPWMQIFGIVTSLWFIFEIGWLSIVFSTALIFISIIWYLYFVKGKIARTGAIYHLFERLGKQKHIGLDTELRGILKEKGLREDDPFEEIVARSLVIDLKDKIDFEDVVKPVSEWLSKFVSNRPEEITEQFLEGTRIGATPVTHGIALPHLRIEGLEQPKMALVRSNKGVHITFKNPLTHHDTEDQADVKAIFFLVSPEENPTQHLRILAQIAGRVDEDNLASDWESAKDEQELKEALLHDEHYISLHINYNTKSSLMIGKELRKIKIPKGCLIAILQRDGQFIIPYGDTTIKNKDRLTVIGNPKSMNEFRKLFVEND